MGKVVGPPIPENKKAFFAKQHVFFVATAPLHRQNRVNLSPKSAKEFRVIDDKTVGYIDFTGSGSETSAHILENGRITIMFVAFTGPPQIVRLYGTGRIITPAEMNLAKHAKTLEPFRGYLPGDDNVHCGFRSVIVMDVKRVSASCGYSIPFYDYVKERKTLDEVSAKMDICEYQKKKNSFSIDGLYSVGQVLNKGTPISQEEDKGYYMAEYEEKPNLLSSLKQIWIRLQMMYAGGLVGYSRDFAMLCVGLLLAKLTSRGQNRIVS